MPLLLLVNQFIFMLGFYMVVPFLAVFMREDLALQSAAIGLVLGMRTFAQQGLFILGGAFADALGPRKLILLGCATRILGFGVLAFSFDFTTVLVGACLTGFAGALFSPAISSLAAKVGEDKQGRARFFAKLAVWGELGAVAGPFAGALLLGIGFQAMALGGAAVFALAYLILHLRLPRQIQAPRRIEDGPWWHVFRDRLFVLFTLAHSGFLLSYNQLYFALPVEITRAGGSETEMAPLFMLASLMIVTLQLPVTRIAQQLPWSFSLPVGFILMALAFATVAGFAGCAPMDGLLKLAPATLMVILLILGQMIVKPIAMDIVARMAGTRPTGVYYGALASAGGLTVLLGNVLIGPLLDGALEPGGAAPLPWLILALVPAVCAIAIIPIARAVTRRARA